MKLDEIFDLFQLHIIKSQHHFDRYKKLISSYYSGGNLKSSSNLGEVEVHHILPRKLYPEHTNDDWNLVHLPVKAHYIAHYLLFKAIKDKSCVYAFNQMRRVTKNNKPNCRLYAQVRISFAKIISENNKGRPKTEHQRKAVKEANKNKNTYRNHNGELKKFVIGQEPMGWVPFQTGRVRSMESRTRMGEKMSGRIWQYHPDTREIKFDKTHQAGFILGFPPWFSLDNTLHKDTVWIHDPVTMQNKRLKRDQPLPDGCIFGRLHFENNGFDKINNHGLISVIDLITKQYCLIEKTSLPNKRYVRNGKSIDKFCLYRYHDKVYTSRRDFFEHNQHLPKSNGGLDLMNTMIPKPHQNQSVLRNEFCSRHSGKTFGEVGLEVIRLCDYIFNEKEIYDKSQ